jgi:hypothetical protein
MEKRLGIVITDDLCKRLTANELTLMRMKLKIGQNTGQFLKED